MGCTMGSNIKKWMLAALFGLFLPLLAACQGGFSEQKSEGSPEQDAITIWAWDKGFNIAAAETAREFYLKNHPKARINIVTIAQDDIVAKLNTRFASGVYDDLPDIVLIEDYRIQSYLHTYPEEFADLSDIANADDFADYKTQMSQQDGRLYGIPFDCGVAGLFYRTDYLEQAGYRREDMDNLSWDQFIEIGKTVKEKTGKYMLTLNPGDLGQLRMMLQSAGSWYTDEAGDLDILENDVLKEAILTYKQIVDSGIAMYIADWGQFVGAFNNGNVATVPTGCWIVPSIENAADQHGKWAVARIPRLAGIESSVNASSLGGGGWYVLKNTGHEKEAKEFLKETFASDVELMNRLAGEIKLVGTLKMETRAENYSKGLSFFGGQNILGDFVKWAGEVPTVNYGEDTYEIEDMMTDALQKIIDGIDMDIVLESTFATAETAGREIKGQ